MIRFCCFGGRRYIKIKQFILWELQEAGIIIVSWKNKDEMTNDIFKKNISINIFQKNGYKFYRTHEYYKARKSSVCDVDNEGREKKKKKKVSHILFKARKSHEWYLEVFGMLIFVP